VVLAVTGEGLQQRFAITTSGEVRQLRSCDLDGGGKQEILAVYDPDGWKVRAWRGSFENVLWERPLPSDSEGYVQCHVPREGGPATVVLRNMHNSFTVAPDGKATKPLKNRQTRYGWDVATGKPLWKVIPSKRAEDDVGVLGSPPGVLPLMVHSGPYGPTRCRTVVSADDQVAK
jgi:hypothetical protein